MKVNKQIENYSDIAAVTYRLVAEYDEYVSYHGHVENDDGEPDMEWEAEIERRLQDGDVWAWADVTVHASVTVNGYSFSGSNSLSGCSYLSEDEFRNDGYLDEMQDEALGCLRERLEDAVAEGKAAQKALASLEGRQQRAVDFNGEGK